MDARALMRQQLDLSHQVIKQSVEDVSDDEARRMPNETLSPVIWQVGHLTVADVNFMRRAGKEVPAATLPPAYPDLFKGGTGGHAAYPPLDQIIHVLDATHDALMRAAAEVDLDAPQESPRRGFWTDAGQMLGFCNAHRWYHIGKITSLRALLGKPRLLR